ncbi:hemerythrin family protein [Propionivibrio sp.]|uniref:bacteriohemerythrin n=1 Tax=Propionivibrio sp. TaxID=2212460 RepID=UPI0025E9B249|nr:hemerythrin family protein [Propionivibrio sp.]MBK7355977.1 hemerythrin family protein [Propionivibrio sp.]MBK8400359.1 hemerythrin family protein [Propionivibrio sp.]MBK8743936.1 hemerythrin family protein [Propionivibrio sp.]MBK8892938.1 hemerythrin family protein [Propionivibrio sp.]MBL0207375.1 hemerythrin family protein [Propionivibrio sp.]
MDMHLAEWSEKLEFGLPKIDSQHKQLFDLAATFAGNGDQIRVMKTLVMLSNYAKVHLREEEAMLASLNYPDLDTHKLLHAEFKGMLIRLLDNARQLSLDDIAKEVQYLIYGWFYNHILQADVEYVPWVRTHSLKLYG